MTWIKLDDGAPRHPKIASLSDRAFRWWVIALCYASEFLTNGLLPPVFWKQAPKPVRAELTTGKLWDWVDPNFEIHDYEKYQSSKEDVEADKQRNRENSKAYRDRRKADRQQKIADANTNVSADASADRQHHVSDPENREQIQRSENRDQRKTKSALIIGGAEYARLLEFNAFVGSVLKVPKKLHAELVGKSGANAEEKLQRWYLDLNDRLEETGTGTGDVFEFLRPRHQAHALAHGWIEAAPKPHTAEKKPFSVVDALARKAGAQ